MTRLSLSMTRAALAVAAVLAGCAAQRAEGPLHIPLGLTPAQTAQAVRAYDFCRRSEADAVASRTEETFPQCGRPGVIFGDAWIVAHYQAGQVVRLQRFERWPDATRAAARWNQLIEKRTADGPQSKYARELIFERQRIPDGTDAWVAFQRDDALIGLYLLRPADAAAPSILEEIVPLVPPPELEPVNPPR